MKTLLSIYIIFSITIATGTCLVCETCNDDDCNNKVTPEECDPNVKSCFSSLEIKDNGEHVTQSIRKSCAKDEKLCNITFSMSAEDEIAYVSTCCKGDLCNQGQFEMPPPSQTENNQECPVCSSHAQSCTSSENKKCLGPQTSCIEYSVTGVRKDTGKTDMEAYQGCGTENFCDDRSSTYDASMYSSGNLDCSFESKSKYGSSRGSTSNSFSRN
ncbi:protein RoBo-1-like [Anomaloglossus baeobatrachus]|uniref:protein RoBo-1-like n=1 Tax=Anomaloglossus baeobatrachus TaxID=238106 RepID=UPI003F4F7722